MRQDRSEHGDRSKQNYRGMQFTYISSEQRACKYAYTHFACACGYRFVPSLLIRLKKSIHDSTIDFLLGVLSIPLSLSHPEYNAHLKLILLISAAPTFSISFNCNRVIRINLLLH